MNKTIYQQDARRASRDQADRDAYYARLGERFKRELIDAEAAIATAVATGADLRGRRLPLALALAQVRDTVRADPAAAEGLAPRAHTLVDRLEFIDIAIERNKEAMDKLRRQLADLKAGGPTHNGLRTFERALQAPL